MKRIIFTAISFSILSFIYAIEKVDGGILFEYYSKEAQQVYLVGSMNNWDINATKMQKDEDGRWKITIKLSPGKHTYKFIVDGSWEFDQENPIYEDDGYGGSNSVIELSDSGKLIFENKSVSKGIKSNFNPKMFNKLKKLQLPVEIKRKKSDFIIKNNFKHESVKKNVKRLIKRILSNA